MEPTLLIVDDEPSILSALKRQLRGCSYRVLAANGGHEGLSILAENDVQVVLSDHRMPAMSGVDFLAQVSQHYPQTVRMVLSGYAETEAISEAIRRGYARKLLAKPWDIDELKGTLDEAFALSRQDVESPVPAIN